MEGIKVLFVAGFGPIIKDDASLGFYSDVLGIELEENEGYRHTDKLPGVKAFALWPLSQAAKSCFGEAAWPAHLTVPHAWIEFDVEDIQAATATLRDQGYELLSAAKLEPWGQTVTHLLSPEGMLVGVTHTPWMRDDAAEDAAGQ